MGFTVPPSSGSTHKINVFIPSKVWYSDTYTALHCGPPKRPQFEYLMYGKKVKVPPLQATKALRVGRGIAVPSLRPRH